jgi:hypothetical protein
MDNISLQRFNHILQKPIQYLTQDEISFLKARRDALTPIQRAFYAEVLGEKVSQTEEPKEEEKKTAKKK